MFLNKLKSAPGARKKSVRVGRGIGCTLGKTCGRGHKGQKARSGGFHKIGFEGGQMPLQRRLPKIGFTSLKKKYVSEVRLGELNALESNLVDLELLIRMNVVPSYTKSVKVIKSGQINTAKTLQGIRVTPGAKALIEAAGGKIEV